MFVSNLPKQICKNASLGLRSLGKKDRNGIRFILKLEFNPKIQTFQWKQGSSLKHIIVSTLYNFYGFLKLFILQQGIWFLSHSYILYKLAHKVFVVKILG
jgi:hypothetical protein